jgi:histidyl-tRNA synthetase
VELFGSADMLSDAEVIAFANEFLTSLGIKSLVLKINSIGCPKCRVAYKEALQDFIRPHLSELCDTCKTRFDKNPMRIIDCKSEVCQDIVKDAPRMIDYLCEECETAFTDLKNYLDIMKIDYKVDADIVRGLDYYTKTAFEFVSTSIGAQGTVCGGGRYDKLLNEIGQVDMPGVGFGLGIERLILQLEAECVDLKLINPDTTIVIYIGEEAKAMAVSLVADLRRAGHIAFMDVNARGMKGQFKYADKQKASRAIIIGEEELTSGLYQVRDMRTGEQTSESREKILEKFGK